VSRRWRESTAACNACAIGIRADRRDIAAALERDGRLPFLRGANFAKGSYQNPTNAWDSGGRTSPLSYFNFAARVPSFGVRTRPRASRFRGSPERLLPDSTYFCAPVGIDPMLENDRHESIGRPGLSSDIQRAIGQRLRQHYAIERSLPARLADLLKEFEQRSNEAETVAPDHVNAA
jgi:hypothetical protein